MMTENIVQSFGADEWRLPMGAVDLSSPLIMGILNVTPDSFSDGGLHNDLNSAILWAHQMRDAGAHIIDVGGESTRPGFDEKGLTLEEERRRVVPVVRALVREGFNVSVDTSRPEIMTECADLGVQILNDIRSFSLPGALEAAAATQCGLVIMHKGVAGQYDNVFEDTRFWLRTRHNELVAAGIDADRICWDPGFGFGKTVTENFELLGNISMLVEEGQPVLVGLSRKSSLGAVIGEPDPTRRIVASVSAAQVAVMQGAQIVRVHDVQETAQMLAIWEATTGEYFLDDVE